MTIGLGTIVVIVLIALIIGAGVAAFLVHRRSKAKEKAIIAVATSEASDNERADLLSRAAELIKKNNEAIKNARKALKKNTN